jgi:hypothetical protein
MNKLFAITIATLMITAVPAHATVTCQTIGNITYCNGTDRDGNHHNSTTQKLGNNTYTNGTYTDNHGNSKHYNETCQTIGNTTYCN